MPRRGARLLNILTVTALPALLCGLPVTPLGGHRSPVGAPSHKILSSRSRHTTTWSTFAQYFPFCSAPVPVFFDVVFLSLGNMGTFETHSRPTPLETCRVHAVKRYRTSARGRRSGHCQKFFRRPFPGHRSPEKGDRSPKRVTGHPKKGLPVTQKRVTGHPFWG